MKIYILIIMLILAKSASGQGFEKDLSEKPLIDSIQQALNAISSKSIDEISNNYKRITNTIQERSQQLLKNLQKKEANIQNKHLEIDSLKSSELFDGAKNKYIELQNIIKGPIDKTVTHPLLEYVPGFDSIQSMIKFLVQPNLNLQGISIDKLQQLQSLNSQLQTLQARLQQANNIQSFIKEREASLKSAFANTGLFKALIGYNKEVFYYQERIAEYKVLLHDKKKFEEKILATVRNLSAFQNFMQKHSYLAQIFRVPENYGAPQALAGLQTRALVQQQVQQRLGNSVATAQGGINPSQYFQQQLGVAQNQMNVVKDKVQKLGGGSSDMTMPDFKPNSQHIKSFLQRFEYGFNVQNQKSRNLLPITSDIALTAGYKLNDKSVIGIGAAFKLGWGSGLSNIHFTSEGIGLRSFLDIKAKGSIWITGGFEYNYLQRFDGLNYLKNVDAWQRSELIGISKKYKVGKKNGNIQVLYDFLANKQVPAGQALKFRIGYSF